MGAAGLDAGGREGDLIEHLWPRYAAPLPPAAFSQPPSDIRHPFRVWKLRRPRVADGGVRRGRARRLEHCCNTASALLPCTISGNALADLLAADRVPPPKLLLLP